MNYWIDTHAHVYVDQYNEDRAEMLARTEAQDVKKIYMPNIDHTSIDGMLEAEAKYPHLCMATMGVHPCSIKKDFQRELYLVEDWLRKRTFAAVGEIGTDLYWDKTYWEQQKEAFLIQIAWAKQYKLPIIIHCRESLDETIAIIEAEQDGNLRGVFHCFGGTLAQAERIIKTGFYMGLGGVTTFKKAGMDTVLPSVDLKHLVLETDAPYLTPVPHRGKRNEPAYIPLIGQRVAAIKQIPAADVMKATTENALTLFAPATA